MDVKIFRINYKSDFILTLNSDAGWMTPFCIKFWTDAPSQAYYVGWDGVTYNHCSFDPSEPTKLLVQFDDHHLPIGDLKFQIAYHFNVADFPNNTEDEVINPANITTEIDGETYQVMLDFTGETAPEIQFSLPAYANEAQRIANEQQRIANEEQRIADEQTRIDNEALRISAEQTRQDNEAQRIRNEQTRINQEEARVREFATLKRDAQEATTAANNAAALANQKAQLAADKAQLAADKAALAQDAANLANQKAQLAADKAALAQDAADLANQKAQLAQQKAEYAQSQGDYAKQQGDYAKEQGDYAKRKGDDAAAQMQQQAQAFSEAQAARQTSYEQAEGTESGSVAGDGSRWGAFKTNEAARDAKVDAKVADITNLQEAVAEGAVYDVSAKNPTAGPNNDGKWESLSALLSDANLNTLIPSAFRRGGMSIKFVLSSDNKYVQYRYMSSSTAAATFTNVANWQGIDDEPTAASMNLAESGGIDNRINLLPLKTSPLCIMVTTWVDNSNHQPHWTIPVNGGEKVEWMRSGSDNTIYYALLTSYHTPVVGETPVFLTGYEGRQIKGSGTSYFLIPEGCKYFVINYIDDFSYIKINGHNILNGIWSIILEQITNDNIADGTISSQKLDQEFVEEIDNIGDNLEKLEQAAIKDSDLTIESTRTNNMANPANIMTGMISNTGAIRTDVTTWEMIKVDVTPGTVVSFGGFNLGRNGYAAFYNNDSSEKISFFTLYYTDGTQQPVENKAVPEGATLLYISIKSPNSPSDPYSNLMVNVGANLLPYEPYGISKITEIKGYGLAGVDPTLDGRVSDLEEDVEELIEQGATIPEIIADLPVSDGTDIASGYAYIDSTTYVVKVKS